MVEISPPSRNASPVTIRRRRGRQRHFSGNINTVKTVSGCVLLAVLGILAGIVYVSSPHESRRSSSSIRTMEDHNDSIMDNDFHENDYDFDAYPLTEKTLQTTPKQKNHKHKKQRIHQKYPQQDDNAMENNHYYYDAIVVGSGLAGLTTCLELLDRGGRVALIEKEATLGGNSLKASSGMNACCSTKSGGDDTDNKYQDHDSIMAFEMDTTTSAGELANPPLIEELVASSQDALNWLEQRVGVDLSQVAQLGGHSFPRTHRPTVGMVGAELIANLEALIRTYSGTEENDTINEGHVTIWTHHAVTQLRQIHNENNHYRMSSVQVTPTQSSSNTTTTSRNPPQFLYAPQIVLATGGFASDRRDASLLQKVRPDLVAYGTTGATFSTGDGIALATKLGAATRDLEEIQLHPTGFVDPLRPNDATKPLAAELLRGVGGLLLHRSSGARFCNELGTRDYVTKQMLAQYPNHNDKDASPTFALVLTAAAAQKADHHVELYHRKRLLTKVKGLEALARQIRTGGGIALPPSDDNHDPVTAEKLWQSFQSYQSAMTRGMDDFGKTVFSGFPTEPMTTVQDWNDVEFYVGIVTPVLHYCMGGIAIDVDGHVLDEGGQIMEGLFAAGEVAGGVHGKNRLGGNSLLECTVFGRKIGQRLVLKHGHSISPVLEDIPAKHRPHPTQQQGNTNIDDTLPIISQEEMQRHATSSDLWMTIHGLVYNLTDFAKVHPGGSDIISSLAGSDATRAFSTVHSEQVLQSFQEPGPSMMVIGRYDSPASSNIDDKKVRSISPSQLQHHSTPEDCWVVFHGMVYDMTEFSKGHKGGAYLIQKFAGKDATDTFKAFHKQDKLELVAHYQVGIYGEEEEEEADNQ